MADEKAVKVVIKAEISPLDPQFTMPDKEKKIFVAEVPVPKVTVTTTCEPPLPADSGLLQATPEQTFELPLPDIAKMTFDGMEKRGCSGEGKGFGSAPKELEIVDIPKDYKMDAGFSANAPYGTRGIQQWSGEGDDKKLEWEHKFNFALKAEGALQAKANADGSNRVCLTLTFAWSSNVDGEALTCPGS